MDFKEWWNNGLNVEKEIIFGLFSDDSRFNDSIICDMENFEVFKSNIALHVTKNKALVSNSEDKFLAGKIIDFQKECLIVIKASIVEKVLFSDLFQCYVVYLKIGESTDPQAYCALICERKKLINNSNIMRFQIMGEKPNPILPHRLRVYNDEY